jgi:DNA-binding winged helix-turn-helix (wHTH) protein/TolB-like protein
MTFAFGIFEFDDASLELRRNGRLVALEPQPARALALLLQRAGDVVTRDELRLVVWGADTHVDFDRGLAYCLSQIRAAIGDKGENPRFVQTLPRRGYSFVAPVKTFTQPAQEATAPPETTRLSPTRSWPSWLPIAASVVVALAIAGWTVAARFATSPRQVIAVSIFDNETGQPGYDGLIAGLSDLVVVRLTQMAPAHIAVVGNAAILRQPRNIRNLKAVAEGVQADYVLLGQLQKDPAGFRFITHFIRLRDGTHLRANRLIFPDVERSKLESAVVAEFERAVRTHVLGG